MWLGADSHGRVPLVWGFFLPGSSASVQRAPSHHAPSSSSSAVQPVDSLTSNYIREGFPCGRYDPTRVAASCQSHPLLQPPPPSLYPTHTAQGVWGVWGFEGSEGSSPPEHSEHRTLHLLQSHDLFIVLCVVVLSHSSSDLTATDRGLIDSCQFHVIQTQEDGGHFRKQ